MTLNEICKALECCSTELTDDIDEMCEYCPYRECDKQNDNSCIQQMCKDAIELIKNQKVIIDNQHEKIAMLEVIKKLNEQDIADRDEMLKQKVEVVYEDFMKDYKCILEENEGIYKELAEARDEIERLRNGND